MKAVATTITDVLRRIRDEQGLGSTRTLTRELLDKAQQLVNLKYTLVQDVGALVLEPHRVVYTLGEITMTDNSHPLWVTHVRADQRELTAVPFESLAQASTTWFRAVGRRPESFCQVGTDLLFVTPGVAQATALTVVAVRPTLALASEEDATEIRNERLPALRALTAAMLLLRGRHLSTFADAMKEATAVLSTQTPVEGAGDMTL